MIHFLWNHSHRCLVRLLSGLLTTFLFYRSPCIAWTCTATQSTTQTFHNEVAQSILVKCGWSSVLGWYVVSFHFFCCCETVFNRFSTTTTKQTIMRAKLEVLSAWSNVEHDAIHLKLGFISDLYCFENRWAIGTTCGLCDISVSRAQCCQATCGGVYVCVIIIRSNSNGSIRSIDTKKFARHMTQAHTIERRKKNMKTRRRRRKKTIATSCCRYAIGRCCTCSTYLSIFSLCGGYPQNGNRELPHRNRQIDGYRIGRVCVRVPRGLTIHISGVMWYHAFANIFR